ncbi:MAG: BadF/BadG/BcrA/BcrD ATPase family protein [Elusimicrobiota bacterium]
MPVKRKKSTIAAIGVDRGGTWTRVAAFDRRWRRIKAARFKTAPLRALPAKLAPLLASWPGGALAPLVIATRGAFSRAWKKPFLIKALAGKLNLRDVISDAEGAHRAAFRGRPGLLLIAGTGAVVFGGRPGAFIKTGGYNPPSGDPGSGRWLGRQYLKLLGRLAEAGPMGHGRSAAYAAGLLARARRGDKTCSLIAAAAMHELAALIKAAAGRGPVRVALAGGLMGNAFFRKGFEKAARRALPGRGLTFITPAMPAEEAAARLARGRKRT